MTAVRPLARTLAFAAGLAAAPLAATTYVTAAIVQGLAPATRYVFRVRAGRLGIFSPYSNEAEAVTDDAPVPCAADPWTLCLQGGRFRTGKVRVYFHPQGASSLAVTDVEAFDCP